jgi:uncharacterized protein
MFLVAVAVVGVFAAGVASISGFGIGSLLTPLLASQYGMRTAVTAVAVPHVIATALRFWKLRRDLDRRILLGFGAMNAAGSLVGALLHLWVNNPILSIVLGILLVFAGITGVLGYAKRMRFGKKLSWVAGAASGCFGGLVGNQGGIRSAAMLGLGVKGPAFVATATAIGIAVDAVRMPVYFATESESIVRAWPAVVAGIISVISGTIIGERVLRRIPENIFRRVVGGILLGVGVYLLATRPH